jgi:hypothetical protein
MRPTVQERTHPDGLLVPDESLRSIVRWLSWGSLLPGIGWLYGLALLWASESLPTRVKLLGSLLFPGGWFGALLAAWILADQSSGYCYDATGGTVGSGPTVSDSGCVQLGLLPGWLGLPLTILVFVAAAVGPVYVRSRGRRMQTPDR